MTNIFSCACLLSAEHEVFNKLLHLTQTGAESQKLYLENFIRDVSAAILSKFGSVQFCWTELSGSLWSHGLQHSRPLCPLPTPGDYSKSCPLSQWCHPTISSSVIPFYSRHQSFPASRSFPVSHSFTSGAQHIGVSSFSISPSNEHSGLISFRMDWLDLLAMQGTLKSLLQHHHSKASILWHQLSLWSNSHMHTWLPEKYNFD